MYNSKSLANLRPYGPGHPPPLKPTIGPVVTPALRRLAAMTEYELFRYRPKNVAEWIAMGLIFEAMQSGFDRGRAEVLERLDGKVVERHETEVTRKIETVYVDTPRPQLLVMPES